MRSKLNCILILLVVSVCFVCESLITNSRIAQNTKLQYKVKYSGKQIYFRYTNLHYVESTQLILPYILQYENRGKTRQRRRRFGT